MTKTHTMQAIREAGARPVAKQEPAALPRDSAMQATAFIGELLAIVRDVGNKWNVAACRIIDGTPDFRAAFINQWKARLADLKDENVKAHEGTNPKTIKGEVSSATVEISRLSTIAKAFNAGATLAALYNHYNTPATVELADGRQVRALEYVSARRIYNFAVAFNKAHADGGTDDATKSFKAVLEAAIRRYEKADAFSKATEADIVNLGRAKVFIAGLQAA